jgi:hypothetical protein
VKDRQPWPLVALTLVLVVWEPATFALYASGIVGRVVDRGGWAVALLLMRVVVTAVGVAAGLALWNRRPWGVRFARVAMVLSAAATIANAVTGALPSNAPPGLAGPTLAVTLIWDAAWVIYLSQVLRRM